MRLRRNSSRCRGSRLHRLPGGHDEDVFAGDAAAGTRPGDGVEIDVMLFREATHSRGGTTTAGAVGVIFGGGWRPQRRAALALQVGRWPQSEASPLRALVPAREPRLS